MVKYIELPSRMFCPVHKCYFSKGKSCAMCDTHPLIVDGNVNSQKDNSNSFHEQITSNNEQITRGTNFKRKYVKKIDSNSIYQRFHNYGVKFDADVIWEALFKYEEKSLRNNVKFKRINLDLAIVKVFQKKTDFATQLGFI